MVGKYKAFGMAGMVILASVLAFTFIWHGNIFSSGSPNGTSFLTEAQINQINATGHGVTVLPSASTIYINNSSTVTVMMGPMNAPSMYSFEIFGVINPEIIVKSGVDVHFVVVNIDDDSYHNFVVSTQGPPYYAMGSGMMGGYGSSYSFGGMMTGYYGNNNTYASMMGYLPPVNSGHYAFTNVSYDFNSEGTYWYLCTYPGHAQQGMYGKIVVD